MKSVIIAGCFCLLSVSSAIAFAEPGQEDFAGLQLPEVEFPDSVATSTDEPNVQDGLANTAYDDLFKKFSACLEINWRILKLIAVKESGLNPLAMEKTTLFTGLIPTSPARCQSQMQKTFRDEPWVKRCADPRDPVINLAAAVIALQPIVSLIDDACPYTTSLTDRLTLIYIGYNNGESAVESVIKNSPDCEGSHIKDSLIAYWKTDGLRETNGAEQYSLALANAQMMIYEGGVKDLHAKAADRCPFNGPPPRAPEEYLRVVKAPLEETPEPEPPPPPAAEPPPLPENAEKLTSFTPTQTETIYVRENPQLCFKGECSPEWRLYQVNIPAEHMTDVALVPAGSKVAITHPDAIDAQIITKCEAYRFKSSKKELWRYFQTGGLLQVSSPTRKDVDVKVLPPGK